MKLLLDTTVLVDVLRGRGEEHRRAASLMLSAAELMTSAMSVAELYAGMRAGEEAQTMRLLEGLDLLPTTSSIAERAGHMKRFWASKGRTLGLVDLLIASTAIEHSLTLATNNIKDFPMPEVTLHQWQ